MRDVLFISCLFPPMGGGGVLRALKFVRYLPAFGWRPLVLAAARGYHVRDESLLAELPAAARVWWVDRDGIKCTPLGRRLSAAARVGLRLAKPWKRTFSFPDEYAWFEKAAVRAARTLARGFEPRLVFATAPPFSAHLAAARIAHDVGVPLVLDYRDLWADNPFIKTSPARARRIRATEAQTLARAAGVVAVTAGMAASLRGRPSGCGDVRLIPNGFDEADFSGEAAAAASEPFTVAYAGQLYKTRMPWVFLEGAAAFYRGRSLRPGDFLVRFLGPIGPTVTGRLERFGVPYRAEGVVSHAAAVQAMREADANLLVIGDEGRGGAAILTGKLFEYLRAGKPILALAPLEGEAAAVVRRFDAGAVVAPGDAGAVTSALGALYTARGGPPRAPTDALMAYDRKNLAAALGAFFDDVVPA
jgi:glycosyltransferase involved in cell wall biosynthesis